VVGVSVDGGSPKKHNAFVDKFKMNYPVAMTNPGMMSNFGVGDTVDLTTFGAGTTHRFAGGVLTLHSGAKTAQLHFNGNVASDFSITSTAAGTVIAHV